MRVCRGICEISSLYDQLSTPLGSEASSGPNLKAARRKISSMQWVKLYGAIWSVAAAIVEFLGSVLALLVSLEFLRSELEQYQLSEKFVHIYGPSSAYHFLHPPFYIVYMILPILFGLTGIVCACGLLGLREWARKGTLFLSTVPVLVCVLLVLFHPSAVFPPDPGQGAMLAFGDLVPSKHAATISLLIRHWNGRLRRGQDGPLAFHFPFDTIRSRFLRPHDPQFSLSQVFKVHHVESETS